MQGNLKLIWVGLKIEKSLRKRSRLTRLKGLAILRREESHLERSNRKWILKLSSRCLTKRVTTPRPQRHRSTPSSIKWATYRQSSGNLVKRRKEPGQSTLAISSEKHRFLKLYSSWRRSQGWTLFFRSRWKRSIQSRFQSWSMRCRRSKLTSKNGFWTSRWKWNRSSRTTRKELSISRS